MSRCRSNDEALSAQQPSPPLQGTSEPVCTEASLLLNERSSGTPPPPPPPPSATLSFFAWPRTRIPLFVLMMVAAAAMCVFGVYSTQSTAAWRSLSANFIFRSTSTRSISDGNSRISRSRGNNDSTDLPLLLDNNSTDAAAPPFFPPGFVWGVATSAYQIEGAVGADGRGETVWDTFVRIPGAILDHSTGDVAVDHYHRWKDDVALMKSLDVNAYRFSIAWSRIYPTGRGMVNEAGLRFYDELVDELLASGIEPWITLFHWDLPQALEVDLGGWRDRRTVDAFADYARTIFNRFAHKVKRFITLNEPWT